MKVVIMAGGMGTRIASIANDIPKPMIQVSNQPVIARGDCSFSDLKTIHDKMEILLSQEDAFTDAIYKWSRL